MHDEDDFLQKLLENPADDTVRLVYADWLDELGDEESKTKAQFLRLAVRLFEPPWPTRPHKKVRKALQQLAAELPTDWLAVVSRLTVEGCASKSARLRPGGPFGLDVRSVFAFVCDKRWDEMATTDDKAIRRCEKCRENIHFCATIMEARERAEKGHCIAVDLGIIRREHDLAPRRFVLGPPSVAALWAAEDKRLEPDVVSLEREERKRNAGG